MSFSATRTANQKIFIRNVNLKKVLLPVSDLLTNFFLYIYDIYGHDIPTLKPNDLSIYDIYGYDLSTRLSLLKPTDLSCIRPQDVNSTF